MSLEPKSDEYFMREALKLAKEAFARKEIPVGAVVVMDKKIIARAYNQTEQLNDSTAHAEMIALTSAFNHIGAKYLKEATLYVTLEPCVMCGGAIFWSQLGRLVFGAEDVQRGYRRVSKKITHPKTKIKGGVLAEESKTLIDAFFKQIRN